MSSNSRKSITQRRKSFLQSKKQISLILKETSSDSDSDSSDKTPSKNRVTVETSTKISKRLKSLIEIENPDSMKTRKSPRIKTPNKRYTNDIYESPSSIFNRKSQRSTGLSSKKSDQTEKDVESNLKIDSPQSTPLRKSMRVKAPNKKYTEINEGSDSPSTASDRNTRCHEKSLKSSNLSFENDDDDVSDYTNKYVDTPHKISLFENILDVEGREMYGFSTPKKRGSMVILAKSTPKTPKTPISCLKALKLETPSSSKNKLPMAMTPTTKGRRRLIEKIKTPRHVRSKLKEEIAKWVQESTESEFSASESDYIPSSEDDDDGNNTDIDNEENKEEENKSENISKKIKHLVTKNRKLQDYENEDYIPECENYFTHHSNHKSLTSDHTLDRLKNPRLPTDRLFSILASMTLSNEHENSIKSLLNEYKKLFTKWLYILNEGYNIILYGLGSKRNLLQTFHKECLSNQSVIVINGFFPSLTIKDILDSVINDILNTNSLNVGNNYHEIVSIIENEFFRIPYIHLFLIIHNIDGVMLRNAKSQEILCRLSKIPNIHLIASIDHINAPLLWDHVKLSYYNYSWWDVTTMLPYSDETAYENSLLVQNSGELELSSLRNVFQSLTTNSKGIFMIIVKNQLNNHGNSSYSGMSFKDLYWSCRESFLVSSDLALRAQLTEFIDHKLIKSKRTIDGAEHLIIPINNTLLEQFMNEQEK